jgi:outer membrane protein OmpA-like peptidoglycan-associated protein/V8-like Glu-specific endopeptidase
MTMFDSELQFDAELSGELEVRGRANPCAAIVGRPQVLDGFAFDKDALTAQHSAQLTGIARCIVASLSSRQPVRSVVVTGHTDPVGTAAYNVQLGRKRAERASAQLRQILEKLRPGVSTRLQFTVDSKGESQPVSPDRTKNRRVEILVGEAAQRGGARPPLKPQEVPRAIPARPARKDASRMPIEVPVALPAGASVRVLPPRAGIGPYLQITGALGKRYLPPPVSVKAFAPLPRARLKELQKQAKALPGSAPDHLALTPIPSALPNELKRARFYDPSARADRANGVFRATTVFPPEDRKVFHDVKYPWSTIGLIETPSGTCSGAMVGPRHVLTCSHGVNWTATGAGWIKFTPAYFDGGVPPFGSAHGIKIYHHKKVTGTTLSRDDSQYDYVVVVLASRLGDASGFMGARSWSDSWDNQPYWWHAGYPFDLTAMRRPTFQSGIPLDGSFWDREVHTRIFHKGDVFKGQSGGPFFAWWSGEFYPSVVAVQSGENSSENVASGGADMIGLIESARRDFP